jgi:hypothetical protein
LTNETKTIESITELSGTFVQFKEAGLGGVASIRMIPLFLNTPEHFEGYLEDARRVIRVLIDGGTKEDLHRINQTQLNAMGINNFLAAMAVEIMDRNYHCNLPKPEVVCRYCDEKIENPSDYQERSKDCGSCGEED